MKYYYKDMEFDVPEDVYYPREDSELLAKTLESMELKSKNVLEMGSGCGFLSILMAKRGASVTAVDINEDAVNATKENARKNSAEILAHVSDMFGNVRGKFDTIVFNPPYLPVGEDEDDETYAGGTTGREIIEMFVSYVPSYLKENGTVIIVISSLTGEGEVISLFGQAGMEAYTVAKEKVSWEELIVIEASKEK